MRLRHQIKNQTWIIEFEFVGEHKVQINKYYLDVMGTVSRVKSGETYGILSCNEEGIVRQLIICSNGKSESYDVVNSMKKEEYKRNVE